jgi:hypothetical protein
MELEFHFEWKRWSWSWLQSPILGTKTIFFRGIFNSDGYVVEAKPIGFLIMTNYSDKKKNLIPAESIRLPSQEMQK